MVRPDSEKYELTEAEKRDLIKLIEQGKPLPEKFRFILFDDKREVELVWNGKSREVCTAVLPFQALEHIDEPRKEKSADDELALSQRVNNRAVLCIGQIRNFESGHGSRWTGTINNK